VELTWCSGIDGRTGDFILRKVVMSSQAVSLPSRFPVGTRYVIEGRAGRILLRYLEFPDGRHVELPDERAARKRSRAAPASGRRSRRRS
jgi:hypothetical protein